MPVVHGRWYEYEWIPPVSPWPKLKGGYHNIRIRYHVYQPNKVRKEQVKQSTRLTSSIKPPIVILLS
jgi:hypothetical protein